MSVSLQEEVGSLRKLWGLGGSLAEFQFTEDETEPEIIHTAGV